TKIQFSEGQEDYYYSFHSKLKEYRILVTSNNNAAVENISMDLPKDEELIKNNYTYLGYNKNESCWGKISAAMGKSANIKEYFQNISDELNNLCNIHASAEYSFDSLEKQISSMIKTAQVNDDFDDID
ncbi:hypothetical protein ACS2BY_29610, partial [Bacillus cereus group sp. BceL310]